MLLTKRFLPYFVTQCLGALNDNIYKNVLLLMVAYSQINELPISINLFVNLAAGLFIFPFFLFSAHAGMIADNMDKAKLIRRLKQLEVVIMSCAAMAILSQSYMVMLLLLFLTGCQSAYFGPVKYSLLPQVLTDEELVKGNAWVEIGTFLAILSGTLSAGLLMASTHGIVASALIVFVLSLCGYLASCAIPALPLQHDVTQIRFAPLSGTWRAITQVRKTPSIWMAIIAISWFWFLGATYLTQFAYFAKLHLSSDTSVVSLLLALFSVGIAVGSFLCERLSYGHVELGVVALGMAGLTLFGLDLVWAIPPAPLDPLWVYSVGDFIATTAHYRLMFDLLMVGVSGGLFIVPLYAFIQSRAAPGKCAQAIAANNIVNALFMVCSALLAMLLLAGLGWSIPELFTLLAVLNLVVAAYIYGQAPEFRWRLVSYLFRHVRYRISVEGREKLPKQGAVLLVCPHTSQFDALCVMGVSSRLVRFVMPPSIIANSVKPAGVIPLAMGEINGASNNEALTMIEQALANGELLCLLSDYLTASDTMPESYRAQFNALIASVVTQHSVKIIPLAMKGLTEPSKSQANTFQPRGLWPRGSLIVGDAMAVPQVSAASLQQHITRLMTDPL
ncbi:MFS transporter [Shewanella algidipiscicola]|uniref:MFS transporter n=1 Tax=Shewanella algidipiscicola TaxID=614070 RepID=A0ABQ4PCI1_9GAMM|nr:MFS transporter [Shewanella algidipiscicola]GIU45122.1 MFS transporter [Shewanella algidipiscicola]